MNHRGLQRALFRMQLDQGFAARLRARDSDAEASTGLTAADLASLRAADPAGVSADRDGKRREQLLGNVASEFVLSTRIAADPAWLAGFLASPHFHRAIASDASLPLAFADYADATAPKRSKALAAIACLECAMARARRTERTDGQPPAPGALALAPSAWLVALPAGVFAFASALRAALDAGQRTARTPAFAATPGDETVLVAAGEPQGSYRLRPVRAEPLEPAVAAFLRLAQAGIDAAGCAAFAAEHAIERADLDAVAADFVADGVLLRG